MMLGNGVVGVAVFVSSAASVVTILNVEPGGNRSRYARGSIGLVGAAVSRLKYALTSFTLWLASGFGSKLGIRVHRDDRAGRRIHHHHRPVLVAERLLRDGLHVRAQAQHDVADVLLVQEQVADVLEPESAQVPAREHVVVRLLHSRAADDHRLVADGLREELAEGVDALVLVLVLAGHRAGQDLAVGAEDLAARAGEVTQRLPGVARVVRELLGVDDLQVGELHDEDEHEADDGEPDAPDRSVHARSDSTASRRAACSASSAASTALSSEMRRSSARITKFAIERRAAVGDERQRHAGERDHARDAADDHERLHAEDGGEPGREELGERSLRLDRDAERAADEQDDRR